MAWMVTSAVVADLLSEASLAHPNECCGLLFGTDDVITAHQPATNVHPIPHSHFEIDPQALINAHRAMRAGGPRLIGYYHSHPHGPPEPSAADCALAAADEMIWAIIARGEVRLWRAGPQGFSGLSYATV